MNRLAVLITAVASVVTATTVVWMEVRQEREFRRLIASGDQALEADRTSEAIEAFSGALAFKPASMLAHLQRAETYRRRGDADLAAALRDAGEAHTLDPTAPQPIELLGDIHSAMARYDAGDRRLPPVPSTGRPRRARALQAGAGVCPARARQRGD